MAKEEEFIVLSAVVKQKEVTLTDLEKVVFASCVFEKLACHTSLSLSE